MLTWSSPGAAWKFSNISLRGQLHLPPPTPTLFDTSFLFFVLNPPIHLIALRLWRGSKFVA